MHPLPILATAYAAEIIVATIATVPVLGEIRLLTHTLMRMQPSVVDGQLTLRQEVCAVATQDDTRLSQTTMPAAFVRALPAARYPVEVEPLTEDSWRFAWDPGPVHVGYLPTPEDAGLPEAVDDPRVADTDQDGQPAATVLLSIPVLGDSELYTVHRNHVRVEGVMRGGVLEASVEILDIAQLTVGASRPLFAYSAEVSPVSEQSSLRMWPTTEGCEALAERWTPAAHPWVE
ncbi:MAG: hypothetical protein H6741_06400 [Alphaproteobacteria bacterium]|nr:hypothetical protein [Alphaproteobacteria bacterium]MCB9792341.1 hypothetical protein [Alphaproteobacteria bacterium]